jgi:hypothetical protein
MRSVRHPVHFPNSSVFKRAFAISPRNAPEPLMKLSPIEGVGNAGCPLHPRPRVHLVVVERTRVTTSTPESPDVPARNGFNGFLRALPGDHACLPPSPADMACLSPVEPTCLRELDASVGASGPHDFAVRCNSRPPAVDRSRIQRTRPAIPSRAKRCRVHRIPCPTFVTIAKRPSVGRDGESSRIDLGGVGTEISFGKSEKRLDSGQITGGPPRVFSHAFFKNSVRSTIVTHLF